MFDKQGNIDESDYDAFGIRLDRDSKGNIVSKHSTLTIRSENRQRAKIMSSKKQRALRLEERAKRKHDIERIQRKHYDNEAQIFKRNDECEKLLRKHMMRGKLQDYVPSLGDAAAESNFGASAKSGATPNVKMLVSFIQVRCERQVMKNRSVKYQARLSSKKLNELVEECLAVRRRNVKDPFLKPVDAEQEGEEEQNNGEVQL